MLVLTSIGDSIEVRIDDKTAEQFLGLRLGYNLQYSVENIDLLVNWKHCPNLIFFDHSCDVNFWQTLNNRKLLTYIPAKSREDMWEMVPMCFPDEYVLITEIRLTHAMDYIVEAIPFANIPVDGELLSDLRHLVMNSLDI